MRSASADYITAANADHREIDIKIDVLWTDPFVSSGNIVTSPTVNNYGDLPAPVVEDLLLHTADTKITTPHKYIVNDGTTINDGTWFPIPGTVEEAAYNQVGWYTNIEADGSGIFSSDAPELLITFAEVRSIKKIVVVGEPTIGQYPTDFDVYVYDKEESDPTKNILNSVTSFLGSSVETMIDFTSDDITTAKSMKLILNSWSDSNTVGKIVEFFGVITDTFYKDDIVSMDVLEEMESDSGSTPIGVMSCNELMVEFQNVSITKDGVLIEDPFLPENTASYLNNTITPNVRLTPYIGFKLPSGLYEYVKMGTFWSTEWDVSEGEFSASVTARDRLEILRNNYFLADEVLINVTLSEVAEYVLNRAKVYIPLNDLQWSIDAALDSYIVDYVWLGKVTYFEALRKIAAACLGRVYCDRDDVITIESFISDQEIGSSDFTISDFFKGSRPMKQLKNYVSVMVCPLAPEEDDGDIYISEDITVEAGDTTIIESVQWEDDAVLEHSVSIYDIVDIVMVKTSETYYPWGATILFTKSSGTEGTFKFKIMGKKLIPVDSPYSPVVVQDDESILLYNKQEHEVTENYLVQNIETASSIANAMLTSLSNTRRDINVEVSGNPCTEIGDIANIVVYSKIGTYNEFRVIRQQFKAIDGYLRCSITGRKTINYGS